MSPRAFTVAALLLVASPGAIAAGAFTALHPEEAYPDPTAQPSADAHTGFIGKMQEKLLELGFAAGPVNGDFGAKTQAALAQFQLSRAIPASGQLDQQTLAELGIGREGTQASVEASAGSSSPAEPQPETEAAEKPEN